MVGRPYHPRVIKLPHPDQIRALCERWKIAQMGLIGSALRDDFREDSDVDVVLTFDADAAWDLFDIVQLREELMAMFGRDVDIIEEKAVRNPYMKAAIRKTKRVVYAA